MLGLKIQMGHSLQPHGVAELVEDYPRRETSPCQLVPLTPEIAVESRTHMPHTRTRDASATHARSPTPRVSRLGTLGLGRRISGTVPSPTLRKISGTVWVHFPPVLSFEKSGSVKMGLSPSSRMGLRVAQAVVAAISPPGMNLSSNPFSRYA